MCESFVIVVGLYLVPVLMLVLTWKKPLRTAVKWIILSEAAAVLLFFPLCAQLDLFRWEWFDWGSMTLLDLITFWKADAGNTARWIWPGLGELGLILVVRWVVERVRRHVNQAEQKAWEMSRE